MRIPDPYVYGIVVAAVSSLATLVASRIAFQASHSNANSALEGITYQIDFQTRAKIAEFRQAWINELRSQMSILQSYGVTPDLDHQNSREFYAAGTHIELLLDRNDPRYQELQNRMYAFLAAKTLEQKFACNEPYIRVCQDVLKTEWEVLKKELAACDPPLEKGFSHRRSAAQNLARPVEIRSQIGQEL